jgi:hypothetical protein
MLIFCVRPMNVKPDGQKETRQIRRTESSGKHLADTDFHQFTGSQGFPDGAESVGIDRNDCSSRTRTVGRGEGITGKMLRQLISEYRNQVAIKRQEIESLETRVKELESLQQELDTVEPE